MNTDKKPLKIMMITSELVPFAKTGGLADMLSALSSQLTKEGHDVRVIMPRYYGIDKSGLKKHAEPVVVPLDYGEQHTALYEGRLDDTNTPVYFIDHEGLYGRDGIYGVDGMEFDDNPLRFALLCRGAFQVCRYLNWFPDVMHSHDWMSGLVPVYLHMWERHNEFGHTASIFTIHNLGYQGVFAKNFLQQTQLPWESFYSMGFEFYDKINFMKAGIQTADAVTTVSPTYAKEILTPEYGHNLDGLLRHRAADIRGILNGVDYSIWNPATDKHICQQYDVDTLEKKLENKTALQKELGLEVNPAKPLFGMVTRLSGQKGLGSLCGPSYGSLFSICFNMDIQFVILGTGEKWCETELARLAHRLKNCKAVITFDNELAHKIYAGSDFYFMPSKYEPCGLNQLYSMRYGTLPIVRKTGGLSDTVRNYNEKTGSGTGFMFNDLKPSVLYNVIGWAVWTYFNKQKHIDNMRRECMNQRVNWEKSAAEYVSLYKEKIAIKG